MISDGSSSARMGSTTEPLNECWPELPVATLSQQPNAGGNNGSPDQLQRQRLNDVPAVWPYGFAFLGVIEVGSTWLAVRRLRTPIRKLPRGTTDRLTAPNFRTGHRQRTVFLAVDPKRCRRGVRFG